MRRNIFAVAMLVGVPYTATTSTQDTLNNRQDRLVRDTIVRDTIVRDTLTPKTNEQDPLVTEARITQCFRIFQNFSSAIGHDTARLREIPRALLGLSMMSRQQARLIPGEEPDDPLERFPEITATLEREKLTARTFSLLLLRIMIGGSIVQTERERGEEHAKEVASLQRVKLTAPELEVIRKHYDAIQNVAKQLRSWMPPSSMRP